HAATGGGAGRAGRCRPDAVRRHLRASLHAHGDLPERRGCAAAHHRARPARRDGARSGRGARDGAAGRGSVGGAGTRNPDVDHRHVLLPAHRRGVRALRRPRDAEGLRRSGGSRMIAPAVDDLVATIRTLVECESPTADHAAVARSADVVTAVGEALLGAAPERIVLDGGTHLRWRLGDRTRVLVLAHHDTVWPLGTLERLPFAVAGGVLTGPGCFDMKAGLAMALHAIAGLDDRDGVTLLVTGDEEVGSPSSRGLIEDTARGARAALVLEASADGGALKLERKGVSLYEVVVAGLAAHAGLEPEKGVNATVEL